MPSNPSLLFIKDVARLIWEYKWYGLAIFIVTILQEFAALWPVALLGQFIDRLSEGTGDVGSVIWLFFGASVLAPGIARANVMLRHKMFYDTDCQKLVELVLKTSDKGQYTHPEAAGGAWARAANAVSGMTNAAYHILGSFTPVIVKIAIVSANLLAYNRLLGIVYVLSLLVPAGMTVLFNRWLRVLLDSQYSISSDLTGAAIKTISEKDNPHIRERFLGIMDFRRLVLIRLVNKGQFYLYLREVALVSSQFLVVLLALAMREELGMTPGDFARIIGYTTQVAAAFITTASVMDAIISYSRAYRVYATAA